MDVQEQAQTFAAPAMLHTESTFAALKTLSDDTYIGKPYIEIGADEWVAGPRTEIQQDADGNRWAVASVIEPLVLVSEEIENGTGAIAKVVLTDEKGLLTPPKYSEAEVELATIVWDDLKEYMYYYKYEWSSDISCVNGETVFNVPPVRIENEDNFVRFDIIPQVEECKVIVKPIFYDGNKDGENDFILPDGAVNYEGVVMVQSALNENSEETVQKTDAEGNMSFKVTPHAPVILKAV